MKLFHGSPKKLKILKPRKARGGEEFENQKAIFLTDSFTQAALYALGKTLKGKTCFALPPNKLIIVGNKKPDKAYVYEVNIKAKKGLWDYYIYKHKISKFKVYEINPENYEKYFVRAHNKKELIRVCCEEKKLWLEKHGFCIPKLKFSLASINSTFAIFDRFLNPKEGEWNWKNKIFVKYPCLKKSLEKEKDMPKRRKIIHKFLSEIYNREKKLIKEKKQSFQKEWNKINDIFMMAISEIVGIKWPHKMNTLKALVSLSPLCPRDLKNLGFDIFYEFKINQMKAVCMHEILHFIYFKKWNVVFKKHQSLVKGKLKLHLSEIVPYVILRDQKIQEIMKYNHKIYKEYHQIKINDRSFISILSQIYKNKKIFSDFLIKIDKLTAKNKKAIINELNKDTK